MSNNQNEEINIGRMVNKINKVLSNGDYKEIFVDYPYFPYHSKLSLYNAEKMIDAYYKDKSCKAR